MPSASNSSTQNSSKQRKSDELNQRLADVVHRRRQHIEKQLSNVAHQQRLLMSLEQKLKAQLKELAGDKAEQGSHELEPYNGKPSLSRSVTANDSSKTTGDQAVPATKVRSASHHRKITLAQLDAYLDNPAFFWNSGEETFVCPVCQNQYRAARLGQIKRHLIKHIHDCRCIMPFTCPVPKCKYAAFKLCEVKRHAQIHDLNWTEETETSCLDSKKKARLDSLLRF